MGAQALSTIGEGLDPVALDDIANREAVLDELQRVLNHSTFKDTKRLKRFLEYVVMETLDGRGARLKGYSLGIEVFDRADDFDPQGDTIVRVQAGQLRRRLDLYYAQDGRANPARILLPKGRYEPVFELRREVSKNEASTRPKPSLEAPADKLARPGILVPSIVDMSGDQGYNYFAEGLTSELVNALVQFRYLRVITGTPTVTPQDALSVYNAQFILSGSLRRAKDLIRVSINLIESQTGAHILSKTFDRECTPSNIFEIQEEIAAIVTAAVATRKGAVNRYNRRLNEGQTSNMAGYDALLKFFNMRAQYDEDYFKALIEEFDEVLEENPKFSSGWAAHSLLYSTIVGKGCFDSKPEDMMEAALRSARRAISVHAENAFAYHASCIANYFAGNFEQYKKDAAMAISLNPNDYTTLLLYAQTCVCLGDYQEAKLYDEAAHRLIAIPAHWNVTVSHTLNLMEGQYDYACEQLSSLTPSSNAITIMVAIAAAGHAGGCEGLKTIMAELLEKDQDYAARTLMGFKRWHPCAEVFEKMRSGFEKAGFPNTPKA